MKLEVMISVMNSNKKDLDKMNITRKGNVINQCNKNDFEQYKNFNIYFFNEVATSNHKMNKKGSINNIFLLKKVLKCKISKIRKVKNILYKKSPNTEILHNGLKNEN